MSIIYSPNVEIGRNRDSALGFFLRSCLYQPEIGLSCLRRALRRFLDGGKSLESFDDLRKRLSPEAGARAGAEIGEGERNGFKLLIFSSPDYPTELLDLDEPPPSLWVWGGFNGEHRVAIVGSRQCSAEGACFARSLSANLTVEGAAVVSGLARGIDSAAHEGALHACRSGESDGKAAGVAVLGSGLLHLYPRENRRIAAAITENGGAVISEYPLYQPPHPFLFPDRNRLISALAKSVVVVEASAKSGSLITARLAESLGRQLFAVPGSIRSENAKGCNELIRLGGRVLLSPDEIDEILPLGWKPQQRRKFRKPKAEKFLPDLQVFIADPNERQLAAEVVRLCSAEERDLDTLMMALDEQTGPLLAILTRLELAEILRRTGTGGWICAVSPPAGHRSS